MTGRNRMKIVWAVKCVLIFSLAFPAVAGANTRFEVSFAASLSKEPVTGRLIVVLSRKETPEPRLTISPYGSPIFGVDVELLRPGSVAVIDDSIQGYPLTSLKELPAGDYYVQALLNVFTECHRSDGHTVWVHLNRSRGAPLNISPGNFYSEVKKVHFDPNVESLIQIELNKVIPDAPMPPDTEWLKHIWIQSELLTKFWGQPIFFGATILLPKGYDSHPDVLYPAVYVFEHRVPFSFSTTPASVAQMKRARSAGLRSGYEFFQEWDSESFPRFIAITLHQPTPFFPSSYSVNSANCGPFGDATGRVGHFTAGWRS